MTLLSAYKSVSITIFVAILCKLHTSSRPPPPTNTSVYVIVLRIFPGGPEVKASACNAGDLGSIPGSGRSPGEGNGNPLQYSCLENPMDGGAWWATVHGVAKNWTRLSDFTFTFKQTRVQNFRKSKKLAQHSMTRKW